MKPSIILGLVVLFSSIATMSCDKNKVIGFINDFLLQQKSPTKVNTILCWNKVEMVQLLKALYKNTFSVSQLKFSENLPYPYPEEHQLLLIDLECEEWESILLKAVNYKLLRHPYRWLVITSNYTQLQFFESLAITIDSRFVVADQDGDGYNLVAPYKLTEDSGLLWNDIGKWKQDIGFEYYNELIVSRNRSKLMGMVINTSMVLMEVDSLNHIWDYKDTQIDPVSKANYIFIHHIIDMLNGTSNFIIQHEWGVINSTTGLSSGMIGDLQKGLAEIGTVAFINGERLPIMDYLAPTTPTTALFIFRAPPLSFVSNIFVLPFQRLVWLCCFLLTAFTALVIYIIVYFEWQNPKYLQASDPQQVTRLRANIFDSLMVQIGGICQQGSDTEPRSISGRTALIFAFIALMFLYTSFSANIVALLQTPSDNIKTLSDLRYSNIRLAADDAAYSRSIFLHETEPLRKAVYQEKIAVKGQPPNFINPEIGIARVRQEFFGFFCEVGTCYRIISDTFEEHEKCGLKEIAYTQGAEPWLTMRKNSTYAEILRVGFRRLGENGLRNREIIRFFSKKPTCTGQGSTFVSVGLIDCYYVFLIFGVGLVCSIILVVMEILVEKYGNKKKIHCLK